MNPSNHKGLVICTFSVPSFHLIPTQYLHPDLRYLKTPHTIFIGENMYYYGRNNACDTEHLYKKPVRSHLIPFQ